MVKVRRTAIKKNSRRKTYVQSIGWKRVSPLQNHVLFHMKRYFRPKNTQKTQIVYLVGIFKLLT